MTEVSPTHEDPEVEWWSLARQSPVFALEQPMASLCLLAEPERWTQLETENAGDWVRAGLQWLNAAAIHRLIADCAESTLHLYERQGFPFFAESRCVIREAIGVRRMMASAACLSVTYDMTMSNINQQEVELYNMYNQIADSNSYVVWLITGAVNGHHSDFYCLKRAVDALTYMTRSGDRTAARDAVWVYTWRRFLRYARETDLLTTTEGITP